MSRDFTVLFAETCTTDAPLKCNFQDTQATIEPPVKFLRSTKLFIWMITIIGDEIFRVHQIFTIEKWFVNLQLRCATCFF